MLKIEVILVDRVKRIVQGREYIGNARGGIEVYQLPRLLLQVSPLLMAVSWDKFLAVFTHPPVVNPVEYDGLEYRWKFFVFRPACELHSSRLFSYH